MKGLTGTFLPLARTLAMNSRVGHPFCHCQMTFGITMSAATTTAKANQRERSRMRCEVSSKPRAAQRQRQSPGNGHQRRLVHVSPGEMARAIEEVQLIAETTVAVMRSKVDVDDEMNQQLRDRECESHGKPAGNAAGGCAGLVALRRAHLRSASTAANVISAARLPLRAFQSRNRSA